ncbi:MAG: hypothetical protein WCQ89_21025, partial [Verrucomicrobiota bacterium]
MKFPHPLLAALAVFLLAPQLHAQAVPPAGLPAKDGNVIELSPFVTTAEADRGYAATSSLAGTRIRTDLKDIA